MRLDCKVSRALRVMEGEGSVEVRDWRDMEEDCLSEYGMIPPVRGTLFSLCGSFFLSLAVALLALCGWFARGGARAQGVAGSRGRDETGRGDCTCVCQRLEIYAVHIGP